VSAPARLVDLDGRVVSEGDEEVAAPLDAFAFDVFVLDLCANRYVMTRTENLAPLLDLPRATLQLRDGTVRNVGAVAAIGVEGLLPGEEVEATQLEGWNCSAP
jgi:hypothetical protein